MSNTIIWDIETYKNCFTLAAEHADYPMSWSFEISEFRDDSRDLFDWLKWLKSNEYRMCGYNNVGFDYPVLHKFVQTLGQAKSIDLYHKAQAIITSRDNNDLSHMVWPSDRFIPQLDLFKIHHFDNKARSTSLKALEFNMRMDNISDLPFPVGTNLTREQIVALRLYNMHDVHATKLFYHKTTEQIKFRESLTEKHGRDFMNHSDVKIGKEIFQMELEKSGVMCYRYTSKGREPAQTKRDSIRLIECIPNTVQFKHPEFQRVKDYFATQVISETKGAFKELEANVGGLTFVFGTGGLHASVEKQLFVATDNHTIVDIDVESLYPSLAITQGLYPEHLGEKFVDVYRSLKAQRVSYKKGTPENAMLKLALNGVYGASGDKFSIFYDPRFTMQVTISGQLLIAMLAEWLTHRGIKIIQTNTDGITMYANRGVDVSLIEDACDEWQKLTGLKLEWVEYTKMAIADVNNYLAVKTNGEVKRKGRYEYDMEWHQNASALVIAKCAEAVLVHGADIDTYLRQADKMDFMLRVKIPRSSQLLGVLEGSEVQLENIQRYYVCDGGVKLVKVMPPLKGKTAKRYFDIESGWGVCPCNDIRDAVMPIMYEYYKAEVLKLLKGFV